jgi:hypothetical protein
MDQLQDILARIGTDRLLILGAFGVAGAVFLRWFGKSESPAYTVRARCSCGWQGMASKLKPRCPLCGSPLDPKKPPV